MYDLGLALILLGFLVIILGIALFAKGPVRGGGVLLIGPIPIVWGTDKEIVKWVLLIATITVVILLSLMLGPRLAGV